jgi:hypothetical protein
MGKIIDVEKAQQALDRAARNARSGPADVRAGRFVLRDASTGRFKVENTKKGKQGAARGKK